MWENQSVVTLVLTSGSNLKFSSLACSCTALT